METNCKYNIKRDETYLGETLLNNLKLKKVKEVAGENTGEKNVD